MQDRPMLSAAERRFLETRRIGHLATADPQAAPHVVPVCFAVAADADALYVTIDAKPKGDPMRLKRLRNIARNPTAAFVADRWDEDWARLGWVMVRGPAEILKDGPEHDEAQGLLRRRYPQYRAMDLAPLPVIAMRIERVASWGDLDTEL